MKLKRIGIIYTPVLFILLIPKLVRIRNKKQWSRHIMGRVIRMIPEKEGFVLDRVRGSHHIYLHPETRQRVVIPVHKKDLLKGTLMEILKQAGIKKDELNDI